MRRLRAKLRGERGNAVVEFVFIFCLLSISILVLVVQSLTQVRNHLAALAIAKETLRTMQLSSNAAEAEFAAQNVMQVFGLQASQVQLNVYSTCVASKYEVRVNVNGASEQASGSCQ